MGLGLIKRHSGTDFRTTGIACAALAAALLGHAGAANAQTSAFEDSLNGNTRELDRLVRDVCPDMATQNGTSDGLESEEERDLFLRCNSLIGLSGTGASSSENRTAARALEQVNGEEVTTPDSVITEVTSVHRGHVAARISQLSSTATRGLSTVKAPATSRALASSGAVQSPSAPLSLMAFGASGVSSEGSVFEKEGLSRLGVFVNGSFTFGDKERSGLEAGYDFNGYSISGGADYAVTNGIWVGAAVGYSSLTSDYLENGVNSRSFGGDFEAKTISGTVYALFQPPSTPELTIFGLVQISSSDYDMTREMNFLDNNADIDAGPSGTLVLTGDNAGQIRRTAKGETNGMSYMISVGGAYDVRVSDSVFAGPTGRLDIIQAEVDGFSETGARGLNLIYDDQDFESAQTAIGFQGTAIDSKGFGPVSTIVFHGRTEWVHEFANSARAVRYEYIAGRDFSDNGPVTVFTDDPDRNFFTIGAGLTANITDRAQFGVDYETVVGLSDIDSHSLKGEIRLPL